MATMETDHRATPTVPEGDRPVRRSRPSSEYWDYTTASWRTAGPIPAPRRGD